MCLLARRICTDAAVVFTYAERSFIRTALKLINIFRILVVYYTNIVSFTKYFMFT